MKTDITDIMGKLKGAELGKLYLKDDIGKMAGIDRTYSRDDFDITLKKLDHSEGRKYLDYFHFSNVLETICFAYWNVANTVNLMVYRLHSLRLFMLWTEDFDKKGFNKSLIQDESDNIRALYDHIKEGIIIYYNYCDLIKGLSERIGLPELEAILSKVNLDIIGLFNVMSLDLDDDNPYKELFQKIDIEELKNNRNFDVKKPIDVYMTWIE